MAVAPLRWWRRRRLGAAAPAGPAGAPEDVSAGRLTSGAAREAADREAGAPTSDGPGVSYAIGEYVRLLVRSGVHERAELRQLTVAAVETEVPDPVAADELARALVFDELTRLRADAEHWVGRTDPERLDRALESLRGRGMLVLPALDGPDVLSEVLRIRGCPNGAVAYFVADVERALATGELAMQVLDESGRPAAGTSAVVATVMNCLAEEGLFGVAGPTPETSVVVALTWRRRPPA
jgi:hypothetical protein